MDSYRNIDKAGDDFWFELPQELKRTIDEAKAQLDNGEGLPYEAVMVGVKKRFLDT